MPDLDEEWENFCDGTYNSDTIKNIEPNTRESLPKASPLYVSTKTKISFLNKKINLKETFWKLPVISYHQAKEGIIKKQMKFNSQTSEELNYIQQKLKHEIENSPNYTDEYIINHIDIPNSKIGFKDVRKISIGLSKKDITSYRCKRKSAFYNCFVVILRIYYLETFKEVHIKVFNTGKLEIPGIQNDDFLDIVLSKLCIILSSVNDYHDVPLQYFKDRTETVLINSNFNCGYLINREKLYSKLKYEYKINTSYDSCSYPGIQSVFFYKPLETVQDGTHPIDEKVNYIKISFMIFRTGSVLIVGKCDDDILRIVYEFVKNLLEQEYNNVGDSLITEVKQENPKKNRKRTIIINQTR